MCINLGSTGPAGLGNAFSRLPALGCTTGENGGGSDGIQRSVPGTGTIVDIMPVARWLLTLATAMVAKAITAVDSACFRFRFRSREKNESCEQFAQEKGKLNHHYRPHNTRPQGIDPRQSGSVKNALRHYRPRCFNRCQKSSREKWI